MFTLNIEEPSAYWSLGERHYTIETGVLNIRPHEDIKRIAEGLQEWPWMARCIKEVQIELGDKHFLDIEVRMSSSWRGGPGRPFPGHRVFDAYRSGAASLAEHLDELERVFALLTHVESLGIFSKRCPFPESDASLFAAWHLWEVNGADEGPYDAYYRKLALSRLLHIYIFQAAHSFQRPIKRLLMDSLPLGTFSLLPPSMKDLVSVLKSESFGNVRSLSIVLERDDIEDANEDLKSCSSRLGKWLASMQKLEDVQLRWFEDAPDGPVTDDGAFEEEHIRRSWQLCHSALLDNKWSHLRRFRLTNLRCPEELLLRFILKHSLTLEDLSLSGWSLWYIYEGSEYSWGELYRPDNFKKMIDAFKDGLKLKMLQIAPTDERLCRYASQNPYDHKVQRFERTYGGPAPPEDGQLIESYFRGDIAWPFLGDNPKAECWESIPVTHTLWKRLPQWDTNLVQWKGQYVPLASLSQLTVAYWTMKKKKEVDLLDFFAPAFIEKCEKIGFPPHSSSMMPDNWLGSPSYFDEDEDNS